MKTRERKSIKQCPQCGWDAEGERVEEPPDAAQKRFPPPPKSSYDCGNCGYKWVD